MSKFDTYLKLLEEDSVGDYGGSHRPPEAKDGAPLYDLTKNGIYPDDVYGPNAVRYYGHSGDINDRMDNESVNIIRAYRNKPHMSIIIYRAVPKELSNDEKLNKLINDKKLYMKRGKIPSDSKFTNGSKFYEWATEEIERLQKEPENKASKITINSGDWVTISKSYAKDHGEHALNGKYRILSKKVKASQIFTDGNSIHEWGYWS